MILIPLAVAVALAGVPGAQDAPEFPKPQKEHSILKQFEGDWDAQCRLLYPEEPGKDRESIQSRGREVAKLGYGDFWLVLDFTGEMHEKPFEGRGTIGYDPLKKKYVLTWFDSLNPRMMIAEGDADESGRMISLQADAVDPVTKEPYQQRLVFEVKDAGTRTLSFYFSVAEGKERKAMEIVYTRRK